MRTWRQWQRKICTLHLLTLRKHRTCIHVRVMTRYHDHAREWLFARGWTGYYAILTPGGIIHTIDCQHDGKGTIFGFSKKQKALAIEFKACWEFTG
jgi:hypothetical protein